MNTGDRNVFGRTIYKGPKGGLYVIGPSGSKLRTFRKGAPEVVVAPARVATPSPPRPVAPPKNTRGRVIHTGARGGRYVLEAGRKIYKFTEAAAGVPAPVAPAPPRRAAVLSPTARPRLTSAERNVRLGEIRRRLSNMRRERIARLPTGRANVQRRLRNVIGRIRARKALVSLSTAPLTHADVEFCHAPASVPRKPCKKRTARVYFRESPLIDAGVIVGTRRRDIHQEWFARQDRYVARLNDYDFWTVQAHTNRSHSWIGPYLYRAGHMTGNIPGTGGGGGGRTHIVPLWPQVRKLILEGTAVDPPWFQTFRNTADENARYRMYTLHRNAVPAAMKRRAYDMYRDDLKRIISKAPRPTKTMVLYRGTGFDIFKGSTGHWHKLKSFCSAAYDLDWALGYEQGYIQRITVLPDTPVLLVAGTNQWAQSGEYEIMVNIDTKYLIRQRDIRRPVVRTATGYLGRARVTDVTIAL